MALALALALQPLRRLTVVLHLRLALEVMALCTE